MPSRTLGPLAKGCAGRARCVHDSAAKHLAAPESSCEFIPLIAMPAAAGGAPRRQGRAARAAGGARGGAPAGGRGAYGRARRHGRAGAHSPAPSSDARQSCIFILCVHPHSSCYAGNAPSSASCRPGAGLCRAVASRFASFHCTSPSVGASCCLSGTFMK